MASSPSTNTCSALYFSTLAIQQQLQFIRLLKISPDVDQHLVSVAKDDVARLLETKSKLEGSFCANMAENQERLYHDCLALAQRSRWPLCC
jgi:hypothetical protein